MFFMFHFGIYIYREMPDQLENVYISYLYVYNNNCSTVFFFLLFQYISQQV